MRMLKSPTQLATLRGVNIDHQEMDSQTSLHDLKMIDLVLKHQSNLEVVVIEPTVMAIVEGDIREEVAMATGAESELIVINSRSMGIKTVRLPDLKILKVDIRKNDKLARGSMIMMVVTLWKDQTEKDLFLGGIQGVGVEDLGEEEGDLTGPQGGTISDMVTGLFFFLLGISNIQVFQRKICDYMFVSYINLSSFILYRLCHFTFQTRIFNTICISAIRPALELQQLETTKYLNDVAFV